MALSACSHQVLNAFQNSLSFTITITLNMNKKAIIGLCKDLGCCDACCLRYIGLKYTKCFENPKNVVLKYQTSLEGDISLDAQNSIKPLNEDKSEDGIQNEKVNDHNGIAAENSIANESDDTTINVNSRDNNENTSDKSVEIQNEITTELNNSNSESHIVQYSIDSNHIASIGSNLQNINLEMVKETRLNNVDSPPAKRCKMNICASCLGVLQEDMWSNTFEGVKEILDKKRYECNTFAVALSSPISIILREKAIVLRIRNKFPGFEESNVTALKESWKWSFATKMAASIGKILDSGAVSPLLITLSYDYPDDLQELEILKTLSPNLFESRSKQRRRFNTEFTRPSVEQALENVTLPSLEAAGGGLPMATAHAKCVSIVCTHSPIYLGGRYIKLSRNLPQTPWVLEGRRVLPSSVQEIIFKPIADIYKFTEEESEQRLKFVAAGREDVDVRCLGDGRPFAIEITDPRRSLTVDELAKACVEISKSGDVVVHSMVHINREDLAELKKGEETKSKTYEALCVKLSHSKYDNLSPDQPVRVTEDDIRRINEYRNTPDGDPVKIRITQKTPIRVLHRRPLLTRTRGIIDLTAYDVPEHRALFRVVAHTQAGTYVKEWACGELGRSAPALLAPLRARAAVAALDVTAVRLRWPPTTTTTNTTSSR